jgi:hypothetical protein
MWYNFTERFIKNLDMEGKVIYIENFALFTDESAVGVDMFVLA